MSSTNWNARGDPAPTSATEGTEIHGSRNTDLTRPCRINTVTAYWDHILCFCELFLAAYAASICWQHVLAAWLVSIYWQYALAAYAGSMYWQHVLAASTCNIYWQHILAAHTGSMHCQHVLAACTSSICWLISRQCIVGCSFSTFPWAVFRMRWSRILQPFCNLFLPFGEPHYLGFFCRSKCNPFPRLKTKTSLIIENDFEGAHQLDYALNNNAWFAKFIVLLSWHLGHGNWQRNIDLALFFCRIFRRFE